MSYGEETPQTILSVYMVQAASETEMLWWLTKQLGVLVVLFPHMNRKGHT